MNPLKLIIEGDASKALASLKAVQGGVETLAGGAQKLGALAKAVSGWLVAYQVAERVVAKFGAALNEADEIGKFSQRTGVSTEALSTWTYAGKLAGVQAQELAVSLRHLSGLIVQANSGNADAVAIFDQLGVAFADSSGAARGLEPVMNDLAALFSRTENSIYKTDAASKLFGDRVGTRLIPFLNSGKEGLDKMGEAAARTGNRISAETAAAAEEFNDILTRGHQVVDGFVMRLTAALLPELGRLADALQHQSEAWVTNKSFVERMIEALKGLLITASLIKAVFTSLAEVLMLVLSPSFDSVTAMFNTVIVVAKRLWDELRNLKDAFVGLATVVGRTGGVLARVMSGDLDGAWKEGKTVLKGLSEEIDGFFARTGEIVTGAGSDIAATWHDVFQGVAKGASNTGDVIANEWAAFAQMYEDLFAVDGRAIPGSKPGQDHTLPIGPFPQPVSSTKDESGKILDELRAARAAATLEGRQLLDEEYRLAVEKLRDQLKAEEQFQEALTILDETYAAKRAKLAADDEKKVLEAAQRRLDIRASEIDAQLSLAQNQQGLTRAERERQQIALLEQRLALQQQSLDLAARQHAEAGSDADRVAAEERIAGLTSQRLAMEQQLGQLRQSGFVQDMREGLAQLSDQWDITHGAARTALGGIQSAVNGVSDGIMGMIDGTKTWGEVFAGVARSIIASVIQMVVQWVAQMLVLSAVRRALNLADAGSAAGLAAAWAPAAVAASIASFGTAATTGGASFAASMLSGVALTNGLAASGALAGFAEGGLVGGGRRVIMVNERGPEFIIPAERVSSLGLPFLEALRSGALGAAALPSTLPRAVASPYGSVAAAGLQQPGSAPKVTVNVGVLSDRSAAREWAQSREGDVWWHTNARRGAVDQGLDT